jgi:hypothetical protein
MIKSAIDERYKLGIAIELSQTSLSMGIYISLYDTMHPSSFFPFQLLVIFRKLNCYNDNRSRVADKASSLPV